MKAIYINIDPYLQAVADWLNAGKPGTAPCFDPLPVAVTIPLGETACIYCPSGQEAGSDPGDVPAEATIDGVSFSFWRAADSVPENAIATEVVPGLSALAPSAKYWVEAVTGDTVSFKVLIVAGDWDEGVVTIPVLVRREQPSGPVDLVDFTPPAVAPSAADINAALGGSGAEDGAPLTGVLLNGAKFLVPDADEPSSLYVTTPNPGDVAGGNDILAVTSPGS